MAERFCELAMTFMVTKGMVRGRELKWCVQVVTVEECFRHCFLSESAPVIDESNHPSRMVSRWWVL